MKLLVATDLSDSASTMIERAQAIAKTLSAEVWLVHVVEPDPDIIGITTRPKSVRDTIAEKFHGEHRKLQALAEGMRNQGLKVTALLVQGTTAEKILHEASKLAVDMIVIGTPGRGAVYQLLVENVVKEILQQSPYPGLVIPRHGHTT